MPSGTPVRCGWRGRDFRSLHFTYLLDGCLFDDDLPIANLEPGVSGRNSLPLPGTPGPGSSRLRLTYTLWVYVWALGLRALVASKCWSLHLRVS